MALLFSLFMLSALQQSPPVLLEQALKSAPQLRLHAGQRPMWVVGDFDRDMRPDVSAVVRTAAGKPEFGVIAVHASSPGTIEWVVPLDVDAIEGVRIGFAPDVVVPLFCVDCDSNIWLRWSGEEYEAELYAVGEKIDVGNESQGDLSLFTSANLAAKPVATVPHCTTVVIRKVGGTADRRWYFVETADGERGWIPATVTSADLCVG